MAAAIQLGEHFGNLSLDVPIGPLSLRWMLTMKVRSLLVEGELSASEIAGQCACTERTVWYQKALLVEFNVIPRREPVRLAERGRTVGMIRLLLAENTAPVDVARQLGVPLASVEQEAQAMRPALDGRKVAG